MINVLIADSQLLTREGIIALFNSIQDIQIVGALADADEIKELIIKQQPQVVMLDQSYIPQLYLPDTITIDPKLNPATFLVLFNKQQSSEVIKLISQGVQCYVCKEADRNEIMQAVYATAKGESFFCECTAELLSQNNGVEITSAPLLTSRETEIIHLVAEGLTNAEIAEKLFLSFHTIKTHRKNIIKKLGFTFKNTAELSAFIKIQR